jgi:hypothetical protein
MTLQSIESRYYASQPYTAWSGYTLLEEYQPFRYVARDDNIVHEAQAGDTWWNLAQLYYQDISDRAAGLWWAIVDFQPEPVVDPTLEIPPSKLIIIPSPATVRTEILGMRGEEFV